MNVRPQQSLTIVVPGKIHAVMATNVLEKRSSATGARQVPPPDSHLTPAKTHDVACTLPQLHFHQLKQLSPISKIMPIFHPPSHPRQKKCKEEIKIKFDIPCSRTATSQQQFYGQHRVMHDIGDLENGALL